MSSAPLADPVAEFERRLAARREVIAREQRSDNRLATARGFAFLAVLVVLLVSLSEDDLSPWWTALPAVVFVGLVVAHGRVTSRMERSRRAARLYEHGLARLRDQWQEIGERGDRYVDRDHPYTGDLDVFGRGSLFQLVCQARTRIGEDTLADWLRTPADPATIAARQAAIDELRPKLDFREDLALLEGEIGDDLDQNNLLRWAREPSRPVPLSLRVLITVLSTFSVGALIAWIADESFAYFLISLILLASFALAFGGRIREVARDVDRVGSGLVILQRVLSRLEAERFETPLLNELRGRLNTSSLPPSKHVRRLDAMIGWLDNSLRNQFFVPIAFVLGTPVHALHAIQAWHERHAREMPHWLRAVGDFEALSSLAAYAYEHPDDVFAEIVEVGPCFEGQAMGHPLLPENGCVRNDLTLGGEKRLLLVSGSNMSGKSTLLRTVGANVVLALAGGPVRAEKLRVSPMQLGTAMRINDSLQDGRSLFYSVVGRLKQVVDLLEGDRPLLFLLDEILQGTNSHDRRVGAEGVIRRLVEGGGVGLVTTHDLALTEIVGSLGGRAVNVHFEDRIVDGKMTFDYRLRPGVVERSNALELMRMMGLDV